MKKYILLFLGFCFYMQSYANERLIIKYKPTMAQINRVQSGMMTQKQMTLQMMLPLSASTMTQIKSYAGGVPVKELHPVGTGAHVIELQKNLTKSQLQDIIHKIKSDPSVEYVEVDNVLKPMGLPSYNSTWQWDMIQAVDGDNFQNLQTTWNSLFPNVSPGNGVVVAVIDTGYTPHSNFLSNLVPLSGTSCSSLSGGTTGTQCYGYTFIDSCTSSGAPNCNQSSPYQPDGLDWGDYNVEAAESTSSWHGSHVTGILVANGYNASVSPQTVLGGAYGASVLPIRALGREGGTVSDIANSILWAVNQYPGINNPTKAQVINLSLGGAFACGNTFQSAINTAIANGAIVVAAAGNANCNGSSSCTVYNVSQISPANCANVISVSAKGNDNDLSWYSSYGNTTITASGGNVYPFQNGSPNQISSDVWSSLQTYQTPAQGGQAAYISYEGTSQATPHVSAAIADLISYYKQRGLSYNSASITSILESSASLLDISSNYSATASTQGQGGSVSGLTLNADNALLYAESLAGTKIVASPTSWSPTTASSQAFTFTNTESKPITIESSMLINPNSGIVLAINSNNCSGQTLTVNATCAVNVTLSSYGVGSASLELIDAVGYAVSVVPINVNNPAPSTPASGGGGGGGCSAIQNGDDYGLILILLGLSVIYIL